MNNLNALTLIGWLLSGVIAISLAVPFWLCWTVFGIGAKYIYWLPAVYQAIPFWDCVGLFIAISIIKATLTPRFATVEQKLQTKSQA